MDYSAKGYSEITAYPPDVKPMLVWDGKCGFCRYWVVRLQRQNNDQITLQPYQTASELYPDIPEERFKKAVQFITTDGKVFSGAAGILKSLDYLNEGNAIYKLYLKSGLFRRISEAAYSWIARHRKISFKITRRLWGPDPSEPRPFWLVHSTAILLGLFVSAAVWWQFPVHL